MSKTKNDKFIKRERNTQVYHTYKDRIFRMLFKEKDRLLELYNALNGTSYTQAEALEINTLENAIFIKMKNDVSFIIESRMCLYEHQSSYNPNMPLRGMFYFADLYKKLVKNMDLSGRKHIKIPTPHYIVFYNGTEKTDVENAVELAVEECIEKDILKTFLIEQKSEVIAMSLYEYNEEYIRKTFFEEGEARFAKLTEKLIADSRMEDLLLATKDVEVRNKLYQEYQIVEQWYA